MMQVVLIHVFVLRFRLCGIRGGTMFCAWIRDMRATLAQRQTKNKKHVLDTLEPAPVYNSVTRFVNFASTLRA